VGLRLVFLGNTLGPSRITVQRNCRRGMHWSLSGVLRPYPTKVFCFFFSKKMLLPSLQPFDFTLCGGFRYFRYVAGHAYLAPGVGDLAFGVDQKCAPLDAPVFAAIHGFLDPYA